ncbi:MAG: hypothetical protein ABSG31_07910 [Tepidisphaeraceae bacterium]|jgi:hypothetical protein
METTYTCFIRGALEVQMPAESVWYLADQFEDMRAHLPTDAASKLIRLLQSLGKPIIGAMCGERILAVVCKRNKPGIAAMNELATLTGDLDGAGISLRIWSFSGNAGLFAFNSAPPKQSSLCNV